MWSVLACLHPPSSANPGGVNHYKPYEHTLNVDGLSFPLQTKDIAKFEAKTHQLALMYYHSMGENFVWNIAAPSVNARIM